MAMKTYYPSVKDISKILMQCQWQGLKAQGIYRTRAIISRGLYISTPFFTAVYNQERVTMARVWYSMFCKSQWDAFTKNEFRILKICLEPIITNLVCLNGQNFWNFRFSFSWKRVVDSSQVSIFWLAKVAESEKLHSFPSIFKKRDA